MTLWHLVMLGPFAFNSMHSMLMPVNKWTESTFIFNVLTNIIYEKKIHIIIKHNV